MNIYDIGEARKRHKGMFTAQMVSEYLSKQVSADNVAGVCLVLMDRDGCIYTTWSDIETISAIGLLHVGIQEISQRMQSN